MIPHPVDIHVGKLIRATRLAAGFSQEAIAAHCGIKFQQVQKYETGSNRVSCSRLYQIAEILEVTPEFFFKGLGRTNAKDTDAVTSIFGADKRSYRLLRLFQTMTPDAQDVILSTAQVLSGEQKG